MKTSFSRSLENNNMNINRIIGVLKQEYFVTIRSTEVLADIFFFPLMNMGLFGFLSLYLSRDNTSTGQYVIMGILLWQMLAIIQYSISVGSLWNVWSRNLSNMFIAPLKLQEYILAHTISGITKALIVFGMGSVISLYAFHFNVLHIGLAPLVLTLLNLALFAFSLGIVILGLIFRFGTRIQSLSWAVIYVFQPLSATFYPLNVLPPFLQIIAKLFPTTYAFEAARYALEFHVVNWPLFGIAFVENIFYVFFAVWFFARMFNVSRNTGQFARNEA